MKRALRRRASACVLGVLAVSLPLNGCLDEAWFKRFREGWAPAFADGLVTAVSTPGNAEAGLRQIWAAFFQGLGAVLDVKSSE